jgi:UDP-N-acetylmuramoyl-L-alanyl-D-glutamate--2,6-diaminopimelate ligase
MTATLGSVEARLASEGLLAEGPCLAAADARTEVGDVTADSRSVRPGALFCAWRGTARDGHAFLAEAAAAGAAAALVERVDPALALPQLRVTDGRAAAAHAAAEFFGDPWDRVVLVGVTGTNGKTTTVSMLRHLLAAEAPSGSIGTLGMIDAGGAVVPGTEGLTTPGPAEAARWLRWFVEAGVERVAMEVSSHALHQGRLEAVRFDAGVFTNLTRDHLDYHRSMAEYRASKLRLLELLKPGGVAALNGDDAAWEGVRPACRTVRFGMRPGADVRAEGVRAGRAGMAFVLHTPDGAAPVSLPLLGDFNVSNALAGAAVLWARGWSPDRIAGVLGALPQVRGRLERVELPDGWPAVLLDYAHTPDALARALAAVRPLVEGRLLVVFGAGGDRDPGKRPEMGRVAAGGADLAIVTSDNPRGEDPEAILDQVEGGMGRAPRLRVSDRREAIRAALTEARPGDMVLLAGKGHETYQVVGDEVRPFDERVVVRELAAELAGQAAPGSGRAP